MLGGVRQRHPLSLRLYVLAIELLVASLRADQRLAGFQVPRGKRHRALVLVYADDLTLFITDEEDFHRVESHLGSYCRASGDLVNSEKSRSSAWGGSPECPDGIKILGINFYHSARSARN